MKTPASFGGPRSHSQEVSAGDRFAFGANWTNFLALLDDDRIVQAEDSVKQMLGVEDLRGLSFLDIGSGSGLFSLAARRLGARVVSFDFDCQSVACTKELKRRYFEGDADWQVEEGSALDVQYLSRLGMFDVVYSWGVLHHTGAMWDALDNVDANVAPGGQLFLALYNYQPIASRYWRWIKRIYNKSALVRPAIIGIHCVYPTLPSLLLRLVQARKSPRGMSVWHDLLDWLGGYPFEVCKPEEILDFYRARGYQLERLKTVGGRMGCNEFVLRRSSLPVPQSSAPQL